MDSSGQFRLAIRRALGTVVVTVHGDLDPPAAAQLDRVLADLIDGQGNMTVVVDLRDAQAADAGGLSVFIGAAERASRRGGSLSLIDPPEILYQALTLRGLGGLVRSNCRDRSSWARPARPAGTARAQRPFPAGRSIRHPDPRRWRPT
jgi:anti-sigma B factor antagonist